MKKTLLCGLLLLSGAAFAQKSDNVGIGTIKPDPSAILDLNSTSKGLLLPRMTQAQRNAIKNPAAGLVIFQTDINIGTYTYDGTTWQPNAKVGGTESISSTQTWSTQGNIIDGTDFIGTANDQPLIFKAAGVRVGYMTYGTTAFIGSEAGLSNHLTLGQHNSGFGFRALKANSSGQRNLAMGSQALMNNTASDNMAIGVDALRDNTLGNNNAAVGFSSLQANIDGDFNTGLGAGSLFGNQSGDNNIGIGYLTGYFNQTGSGNIGIGSYTLFGNGVGGTSIQNNLAIGFEAGRNLTGSGNVLIGRGAAKYETNINNMLYINNSEASTPLIKGDFTNTYLKFHTGTATPTATAGFVAIGDFTAAGATNTPGTGAINTFPSFTPTSKYRLIVQDGILTEKLKVALRNGAEWADYVFAPDYKLMSLEDVEKFTLSNKHLPNVPSADEMAKNGLDVTQTSAKLMEKIEELTLYVIELNKRIKELEMKK